MAFSKDNPIKGHVFVASDDSTLPDYMRDANRRARRLAPLSPEQKQTEAAALTARYAVVDECKFAGCKEPLIAEEIVQHMLHHENGTVRSMVGTVLQQSFENQQRTLEVLTAVLNPKKEGK